MNSQTTLKPNARVDDPLEYTEAGYPAESRSGLYEHLKLPKGTVVSAYNPCEQEELRENCLISLRIPLKVAGDSAPKLPAITTKVAVLIGALAT